MRAMNTKDLARLTANRTAGGARGRFLVHVYGPTGEPTNDLAAGCGQCTVAHAMPANRLCAEGAALKALVR